MYDFYFGTPQEVQRDEKKFLLTIKRMLPRWVNSIPDSEYLAIVDILEQYFAREQLVLVETGVGASTIALLHHALKYQGVLFSWDIAGPKGAYIRGVCTDTLLQFYKYDIFKHWKFVAYNSLSPYLGIKILPGFVDKVDFCFLDSEHTLDTVLGEIGSLNSLFIDGSIVAMDDANYTYRHTNIAYVNMFRRKLGLSAVDNPDDNRCDPLHIEVECYLKERWAKVEHIHDTFKTSYNKDLFYAYYSAALEITSQAGMEKMDNLEHRFDAWRVSKRIV